MSSEALKGVIEGYVALESFRLRNVESESFDASMTLAQSSICRQVE